MERFTLDETRAAEWLTASVALNDSLGDCVQPEDVAEIGSDYDPRTDYEGNYTPGVVYAAQAAKVITGPGEIIYDAASDADGSGYTWIVYVTGPGNLKLASAYEETRRVGDPDATGVAGALGVLREARDTANFLLDNLASYVAAQS